MSQIRPAHPGVWSLVAVFLVGLIVTFGKSAAPHAADKPSKAEKAPKADKPGEPPKPPQGRNPRAPSPPMKDLRLQDEEEPAEEQILLALAKSTTVRFDETPLEEALAYLREEHKVNLWLDRRALREGKINIDEPVTLHLADVRFESVLNLILDPLKLEWLIQDEVLKITTHEGAMASAETVSFDVQNLLDAGHTPEELIEAIVHCIEPETWSRGNGDGGIEHSGGVLICRQTQRIQSAIALLLADLEELAEKQLDESASGKSPVVTLKVYRTDSFAADELAKSLETLVAPDTWKKTGISLHAIEGALFVQQTPHVHREIERVLKQLIDR